MEDMSGRAIKVRHLRRYYPYPLSLMEIVGLLPGDRNLEAPGTSKYCALAGHHYLPTPPADFGMDVWRRSTGIYQGTPRNRSTWPRRRPFR